MRPTKTRLRLLMPLLSWSLVSASFALAQTDERATALEVRIAAPATVTVWNRAVVVLRASIEGLSPEARAEGIRQRIEALPPEGAELRAERATIRGLEGVAIFSEGQMLFGLIPQDLDPESSESLEVVAETVVSRIDEILEARAQASKPAAIMRGFAYTAGSLVLLILFCVAVRRIRRWLLQLRPPQFLHNLGGASFDVTPALAYLVSTTIRIVSVGLILSAVYSFVAFALSEFPYSRPWGEGLGRFVIVRVVGLARDALHAVPGFFTAVLIFAVGRLIVRAVSDVFERVEKGHVDLPWLDPHTARATRRILVVLIYIFVATAAYPYIPGASTDAFKGISVFVGIMASIGGAGFVNQIMSGLVVVYSRSVRIGDYVRIADKEGVVSDVGALSTKIVTRAREEITVPNAVLVGNTVTNFTKLSGENGAVVQTTATIGYDTPWRQVHALLELAAERTSGLRKSPKPTVLQRALSDFYVEYQLLAHLEQAADRFLVLSELHAQIQDAFNEFDVQIMSPHFERQPSQKVLVDKQGWSPAPAGPRAS